jgi:hypothetical protein
MVAMLVAAAAPVETIAVVGFGEGARRFTYARCGEGGCKLEVVSVDQPLQSQPLEANAKVSPGSDPGQQRFKSGTLVRTEVEAGSQKVTLAIDNGQLHVTRGSCSEVYALPAGTDHNLFSVLSAKKNDALAIITKRTVDGQRTHAVVLAPLSDCAGGPSTCLVQLGALAGNWEGQKQVKDFEGGGKLPEFSIELGAGQITVNQEPAVGPILKGSVTGCEESGKKVTVKLSDGSSLQLEDKGGPLAVTGKGPDGKVSDTFHRAAK